MIKLNDYLYSGDTVIKIMHSYADDLKKTAYEKSNIVDLEHYDYLNGISDLLEHNDFLTSQSKRIIEFYKFMAEKYPYLAFTFKGRIKSLVRAEEKFNRNLVVFINEYYEENGCFPEPAQMRDSVSDIKDIIAYRIVISLPKCHVKEGEVREEKEREYLYEIAEALPKFLEERDFTAQKTEFAEKKPSKRLNKDTLPYYKDYVEYPREYGYKSLHVAFYDNQAKNYMEVQLRTKEMDDFAEIGRANHENYEQLQAESGSAPVIEKGKCVYYDEAYERLNALQNLDLAKVDVNMFGAVNNMLINDGCGFFRGRLILPYEHLSRFQNDLID